MKQPIKPENAPENIEWNDSLKFWMALIHTSENGEEVWHYWNKHGYLFAEITYDKDDNPIKNQQFPPEGTDKNAVYVVPYDKWVVPKKEEPKSDFESFRTTLLYGFGDIFCHFAGGKTLGVDDSDVKYKSKNRIYPDSGDWVFYDKRGQAGTFGVSHDDFSIRKVTLKNPEEHEVDYSLPKIKRVVSTQKLNERYVWLAFFFCDWEHKQSLSPFNMDWGRNIASLSENVTALNKAFNKEIKQLKDDPYLAMY